MLLDCLPKVAASGGVGQRQGDGGEIGQHRDGRY